MPDQNIVGIFDLENTSQSRITRDYLAKSEKKGQIVTVADDIPRTFIVCRIEFEERKYGRNYRTY